MQKILYINSEQEMIDLGFLIGKNLEENNCITLYGDLGAGKTTLTKGIGKALEIKEIINSPTFTILKIYQGRLPLYHMDAYRINKDSHDDDLEEFFEMDGVTVVEWAENINYLLPKELLKIKIDVLENNYRKVVLEAYGEKYKKFIKDIK